MKALSIRQPWAHLIVHGAKLIETGKVVHKDVENRTWTVKHRGPLAIHASTRLSMTPIPQIEKQFGVLIPREALEFGKLIGVVDLRDVVTRSTSIWFEGLYGWIVGDPRAITPVPMRGVVGLFNVAAV